MAKNKILIVDDDANIAELIKINFESEGFDTITASNGREAVDKFRAENPSIVIMDVMMPEMDGWEACREIRKTSNTPIIMLTAKGETFDKVLGLELGADDYMVKPFETKELTARVKAVLRRTESHEKSNDKSLDYMNLSINISNLLTNF